MAITAAQVKELREATGLPMMKCKEALVACDGDMDAAIDHLRKQGLAAADKRAHRDTNSGSLGLACEGGKGVVVLVSCETDFVAKNPEFKDYANAAAAAALAGGIADVDALGDATMADGRTVTDGLNALIQKIGENMKLVSVDTIEGEQVIGYNHGGRVAALVTGTGDAAKLKFVAMHVAAANPAPIALDRDRVDQETLDKERSILAESEEVLAKPEQIRPKIVEGKLNRFYKEFVLLEQEMLVDCEDKMSVEKYAKANGIAVTGFVRVAV